jgi:hypothetical protein
VSRPPLTIGHISRIVQKRAISLLGGHVGDPAASETARQIEAGAARLRAQRMNDEAVRRQAELADLLAGGRSTHPRVGIPQPDPATAARYLAEDDAADGVPAEWG